MAGEARERRLVELELSRQHQEAMRSIIEREKALQARESELLLRQERENIALQVRWARRGCGSRAAGAVPLLRPGRGARGWGGELLIRGRVGHLRFSGARGACTGWRVVEGF